MLSGIDKLINTKRKEREVAIANGNVDAVTHAEYDINLLEELKQEEEEEEKKMEEDANKLGGNTDTTIEALLHFH